MKFAFCLCSSHLFSCVFLENCKQIWFFFSFKVSKLSLGARCSVLPCDDTLSLECNDETICVAVTSKVCIHHQVFVVVDNLIKHKLIKMFNKTWDLNSFLRKKWILFKILSHILLIFGFIKLHKRCILRFLIKTHQNKQIKRLFDWKSIKLTFSYLSQHFHT